MSWRNKHDEGMDVLGGVGIGDFVPWLNVVGKVAGGLVGGSDGGPKQASAQQQIQQAMEKERQRQAQEKAAADARRTQYLLYGVMGLLGVGGAVMIFKK